MSSILDALGYLGDTLGKPGRAVRGLLGGRPEELAAAIPFSDSLGLSDPAQQVSGHDLLRQIGFDPGDGIGGTLAGIGADVATDPLTYFGGAMARGLLRGGRAAAEAGPESHIFDLVTPEERAAGLAMDQGIERMFPIPTTGGRLEAAGIHPADLAGEQAYAETKSSLLDSLAGTRPSEVGLAHSLGDVASHPMFGEIETMPPWSPAKLADMGHPRDHGFGLGISPEGKYDPTKYGLSSEMIGDGEKMLALQHGLGEWDKVLGQFHSLPPDELAKLGRFGSGNGIPSPWLAPLADRASEVGGLNSIIEAVPGSSRFDDVVSNQHHALQSLLAKHVDPLQLPDRTGLGMVASDLVGGNIPPSMVPGFLGTKTGGRVIDPHLSMINDYGEATLGRGQSGVGMLSHLPVDEGLLRKLAAQQQVAALERKIGGYLDQVPAMPESSLSRLTEQNMAAGFEPNLVRQVYARPDIQERIAEARQMHGPSPEEERQALGRRLGLW